MKLITPLQPHNHHRWAACPGSAALEIHYPATYDVTDHARELARLCFEGNREPEQLLGERLVNFPANPDPVVVSQYLVEAVEPFVEAVREVYNMADGDALTMGTTADLIPVYGVAEQRAVSPAFVIKHDRIHVLDLSLGLSATTDSLAMRDWCAAAYMATVGAETMGQPMRITATIVSNAGIAEILYDPATLLEHIEATKPPAKHAIAQFYEFKKAGKLDASLYIPGEHCTGCAHQPYCNQSNINTMNENATWSDDAAALKVMKNARGPKIDIYAPRQPVEPAQAVEIFKDRPEIITKLIALIDGYEEPAPLADPAPSADAPTTVEDMIG